MCPLLPGSSPSSRAEVGGTHSRLAWDFGGQRLGYLDALLVLKHPQARACLAPVVISYTSSWTWYQTSRFWSMGHDPKLFEQVLV